MAKDHKEFGKWKATVIINGALVVKRFEKGYTIKKRGESITENISCKDGTTDEGLSAVISSYERRS